jgi:hypothetical protein
VRKRTAVIAIAALVVLTTSAAGPRAEGAAYFGFNDAWHKLGPTEVDLAQGAGANTARIPFGYEAYQNSSTLPGIIDDMVDDMNASGIEPHLVPGGTEPPDQEEYNAVVQELADDFAGRIRGIEVWNEPNGFVGGNLTAAQYIRVFNSARHAIHQIAPGMTVLPAGLAPVGNWGWYLDQISRENGDFNLAAHIYPRPPGQSGPQVRNDMRRVVEAARIENHDRKVWVTETGISSGEYSEAQQATRLVNVIQVYEEYPRVKAVYVHRLKDDPDYFPENPWEQGLGLVRSDGTLKPAYTAVAGCSPVPTCL